MISEEMIVNNKQKFIELVKTINRPGAMIEDLISKLEMSDFFTAPASTKYSGAYKGGLCAHCLRTYENMKNLVLIKNPPIPIESIIIVSLFHDFYKMNFYETYYQNKKVYSTVGSKRDEGGNYDWKTVSAYKVKETEDRFLYGNNEMTSEFMIRCYIPLTLEESVAILHHMGGKGFDSVDDSIPEIFERYPLALYLHMAEMMSSYIDHE